MRKHSNPLILKSFRFVKLNERQIKLQHLSDIAVIPLRSICRSKIKIFHPKNNTKAPSTPTYTNQPRLPFRSRFLPPLPFHTNISKYLPTYHAVFNNCAPPPLMSRKFHRETAHGEPAALWTSRNTIDERERASNTTWNRRGKSEPSSSKRLAKHTEIILRVQIDIGGRSIGRKGGSSLSKYCLNEREREREGEKERREFSVPYRKGEASFSGGGSGGIHEGVDEEAEVGETFISPLFLSR